MDHLLDSKYYDFQTTVSPLNGLLNPPPGEKWVYVQTILASNTLVTVWAKRKEVRPAK